MTTDPRDAFIARMLDVLGYAPELIEPGRLHRFSTNGRRGDAAGWCKLFPDLRAGVFGDYRTGISEVWTATDRARMTPAERATVQRQIAQARAEREAEQRQRWEQNRERNARTWQAGRKPVPGDPLTRYLKHRLGVPMWPLPACLRFHPSLAYWHEGEEVGRFPAMLAAVTSPAGDLLALHRTWLTPDGRKANAPGAVKKLSGAAGPVLGGCIRLSWPKPGERMPVFGVAEGIETSLAAELGSGVPTVAAYSGGALAAWQWPEGVRSLVVFADHDDKGQQAAQKLRERAARAGVPATVMTPTEPGSDWCDVWAARGAAQVEGGAA